MIYLLYGVWYIAPENFKIRKDLIKMTNILNKFSIRNFIFLTIAGIINAIGVTLFIAPVDLYDSGVSGTSILLSQLTPEQFSLSLFLLILNVPLFLFGLKKLGLTFTIYSIYAVTIYSVSAWLITDVLPVDVSMASPLAGTDLLLCALFGGIISGIGSGLTIRHGGAIDGIDVLAVTFAKKLGLSIGSFVMIYNLILYIICGFVMKSWILPLYSIVTYAAASKTIDYLSDGIDRSKSATIITDNPDEIGQMISDTFKCGITVTPARGFYSGEEKTMLYVVINRFQIQKIKTIVKEYDPNAYVSITEIADVYHGSKVNGEG